MATRELIYSAKVAIEGVTELLMHRYVLDEIKRGKKNSKITNPETSYEDEWIKGTYLTPEGLVCIPSMMIEAMLRNASIGQKVGKHFLSKIIPTGCSVREFEPLVTINGNTITIDDIRENDWKLTFPVVVKTSRVSRTRTALPPGWRLDFHVDIISKLLKVDVMEEIFQRAGYAAGLGDWRPSSKSPGKFGQFELIEFSVQ